MTVKNTFLAVALVAAFAAPAFAAEALTPPVDATASATVDAGAAAKAPEMKKEIKKHHKKHAAKKEELKK